ncbi:MAG: cyclase family protein [Spirochaetia bacterium]|nr:cyclase family protein [Spirochaetia bacterium]
MKECWIYLSHKLEVSTPAYGNGEKLSIQRVKSIDVGDSSNNSVLIMSTHLGTHVDSPFHFDLRGRTLDKISANEWVYNNVYLIEYHAKPCELIGGHDWLEIFNQIPVETDLLLVKTDFEKYRNEAREKPYDSQYIFKNPGWRPEAGSWLRKNRKIRAVGFDFISLTSYENRELGREAHRAFLGTNDDTEPILIVEDMKLSEINKNPKQVIILPIIFENADGSPVTVIARA